MEVFLPNVQNIIIFLVSSFIHMELILILCDWWFAVLVTLMSSCFLNIITQSSGMDSNLVTLGQHGVFLPVVNFKNFYKRIKAKHWLSVTVKWLKMATIKFLMTAWCIKITSYLGGMQHFNITGQWGFWQISMKFIQFLEYLY